MTNAKEKTGCFRQNIITFLILFLSCSFVVENDLISSTVTIALWVITAFLIISFNFRIKASIIFPVVILLMLMWVSVMINEPQRYFKYLCISFSLLVICLYVHKYSILEFIESFCNVVCFLAIVSLVCYVLYSLFPVLKTMFLEYGKSGKQFSVLYIYVNKAKSIRNMGMFWEPGAYQTYLNIALLLEVIKEKKKIQRIVILALTIATTFSTTGFISMSVIFIYMMFNLKEIKSWQRNIITILLLAVVVFFINADSIIQSSSGYTVFGKLSDLLIVDNDNSNGMITTTSVRYYSIIKPIEVFLKNPILGVGYDNLNLLLYDYTHGMNTCTFINYFALFGVLYGLICILGYIKFAQKVGKKIIDRIAIFLIICIVSASENYVLIASLYWFCFYGFDSNLLQMQQEKIEYEQKNRCY